MTIKLNNKYKIVLIGSGNLAEHFVHAFSGSNNSEIIQIYSRSEKAKVLGLKSKIDYTNNIAELKDADLYLISVNDSAIRDVSEKIPFSNKLVAHSSGATSIDELSASNRRAVFYPLQSFSKGKESDFSKIPVCLEAENDDDLILLRDIASSISLNINNISSEQREYLHAAAVFVNNFTNHMFYIGKEIADHHNVDFELLKPLIKETVDKIESKSPVESQTGPAVRGDSNTLEKHLKLIPNEKHREIYRLITESIFETYNK